MQWYVVHCRPSREWWAATTLRTRFDIEVYVAEVSKRTHGYVQAVPLFPGYIFVRLDLAEVRLSAINSSPGVLRLLAHEEEPNPLPEEIMDAICDGVERLNAQGGLLAHNFQPGDKVSLKSGRFRGLEAVFLGSTTPHERVKVLLKFLGRPNEVHVSVDDLEEPSTQQRRGRATRGGGRKINHESRH